MTIAEEIEALGDMCRIGGALREFAESLQVGTFKKKSAAWIYNPNFVGFELRFKRVKKINVLLRDIYREVPKPLLKVLPLHSGPLTFVRAEIQSARQLGAACVYIETSWRDWYRDVFHEEPKS